MADLPGNANVSMKPKLPASMLSLRAKLNLHKQRLQLLKKLLSRPPSPQHQRNLARSHRLLGLLDALKQRPT